MNWIELNNKEQLEEIDSLSQQKRILIFKHSTRCSISSTALSRLERNWPANQEHSIYLLDLLKYRDISDLIAKKYDTAHQSPQILIIDKGKCILTSSHFDISAEEILKALA